ncbi:MAG TPA: transporter [Alphaproteobacteria bacterium]|nr:transporter [Alphaproteobacteria bacterium]
MIGELFGIVAPVFATAGLGYGWSRAGYNFDSEMVSRLVINIGMPCMVFSTLSTLQIELSAFGQIVLAAILSICIYLAVGGVILRSFKLPLSHYLPSISFSNGGNMGLPICLFAFGDAGLALGTGFFLVNAVAQPTLGVWINSGKLSPAEMLRTPIIYVIPVALWFRIGGFPVPEWIANTTQLVGGITLPLMLLLLGVSLSRIGWGTARRSGGLAVLRISMGLATGWGVASLLGLSDTVRGVLLLQAAMPAAVINYVFALRYETDPETVAGVVMQSTLMSMFVLPVLLAWLLP